MLPSAFLKYAVAIGFDFSQRDGSCLTVLEQAVIAASKRGRKGEEIVGFVLDQVPDPAINDTSASGFNALPLAERYRLPETVKLLVARGARVSEQSTNQS